MKRIITLIIILSFGINIHQVQSQLRKSSAAPPTYEELYDAPYEINKLFVQFQPLYGELFTTNVNMGFGLQAQYFWDDKMDFQAHFRKAYAQPFDFTRDVAEKNKDDFQGYTPNIYSYYELGATYHIKDTEQDTETKFILYSKRYKGNKWAAKVPDHIKAPTKVRKIIGARLGGTAYTTAFDLKRTLDDQGVALMPMDSSSAAIDPEAHLFGNMNAAGLYVGASLTLIKNVAIKFDKTYGIATSDLIFTGFFDILMMPSMTIENILYKKDAISPFTEFSSENLKTNMFGFRAGIDGKFNRELSWGYGLEVGYRPSVQTKSMYAMFKISFPVFSTTLSHEVEAFGK
ncbi:MAG: hypothetical protein ACNS62_05600 [Candidatus Cyclobacteriaceae bacterium M3_2C_046]